MGATALPHLLHWPLLFLLVPQVCEVDVLCGGGLPVSKTATGQVLKLFKAPLGSGL